MTFSQKAGSVFLGGILKTHRTGGALLHPLRLETLRQKQRSQVTLEAPREAGSWTARWLEVVCFSNMFHDFQMPKKGA